MNKECCGAHNVKYIHPPTKDNIPLLKQIVDTKSVKAICVAPEVCSGININITIQFVKMIHLHSDSLDFIEECVKLGLIVAVGHVSTPSVFKWNVLMNVHL